MRSYVLRCHLTSAIQFQAPGTYCSHGSELVQNMNDTCDSRAVPRCLDDTTYSNAWPHASHGPGTGIVDG